ncbi:MAG: methyltransferase domain-containing protein [Candidatus Omnitrophica bacterium]|nr:methyltransferase domain-containing protein [Candidatus Omnitrophota bacterium]
MKTQTKSLSNLMLSYSVAGGLAQFINLVAIVMVVRNISVAHFGLADLLRTAQWFLTALVNFNIFQSTCKFYFDTEDENLRKRILGGGISVQILAGLVSTLLLLALAPLAQSISGLRISAGAIWLVALAVIPTAVMEAFVQVTVTVKQPKAHAVLLIAQAALTLLGVLIFVLLLKWGLEGYLAALLLASVISSLIAFPRLAPFIRLGVLVGSPLRYIRFGGPFTATTLIQYGFGLFIRLFLARFASATAMGWYGFAERAQSLLTLTITGAGKAWLPWLFARQPKASDSVAGPVRELNGIVLLVLGGMLIFLRDLIALAGGTPYAAAHTPAALLLIAAWVFFLGDWIVSGGMAVKEQTYHRIWIYAISYGAAILLAVGAISRWGAAGAAMAYLLACVLIFIGMLWVSKKIHPLQHGLRILLPSSLAVIGLALLLSYGSGLGFKLLGFCFYLLLLRGLGILPQGTWKRMMGKETEDASATIHFHQNAWVGDCFVSSLPAGTRILSVGEGYGELLVRLAQTHPYLSFVGTDLDLERVRHGNRLAQDKALTNLVFCNADITRLPFRSESFTVVIARGVLHILQNPQAGLDEIRRIGTQRLFVDQITNRPFFAVWFWLLQQWEYVRAFLQRRSPNRDIWQDVLHNQQAKGTYWPLHRYLQWFQDARQKQVHANCLFIWETARHKPLLGWMGYAGAIEVWY